jgi:ATP-dependent DNA helicase PIF1
MFAPERNDDRLNNYNRLLTLCWLANLDIAPILSEQMVCDYVGKYVTKAEIPTLGYQDIVKKLLPNINANRPMLSLVARLMNALIGERDWSSQVICHLLLNLPLQAGSRIVINVDLSS